MLNKIKNEIKDCNKLLANVPASVFTLFVISLVLMNLLANKELISIGNWLALDCGMLISWLAFFTMDLIARRFGPKASVKMNIIAIFINLFIAVIFILVGMIPGNWSMSYEYPEFAESINTALNGTISGTWYVLMGSTIAFFISGLSHASMHKFISKLVKNDGMKSYLVVSYVSTCVAQFVDNIVFALIVSMNFFSWTFLQCITCALTGMIMELTFEFIFGPAGFKICENWEKNNVGSKYLEDKEV